MMLPKKLQTKLSIVIPAYNEEGGISGTLEELKAQLPDAEIIVIDDGSTDETVKRALQSDGARIYSHSFNRGYGAAVKTAMRLATRDYVAWFDADNEHRVEDLERIVQRIDEERLVAVIGMRPRGNSLTRTLGKALIRLIANSLLFQIKGDINCGLRVFNRKVFEPYIGIMPNGFSASMTSTLVLLERGYPVGFEPVTPRERIGQSKVRLGDGFRTILLTLRLVLFFAPLRVFFSSGMIFCLFGAAYSLYIALNYGAGIPVGGGIILVAGMMLIFLGLIADQISQMRLGAFESAHMNVVRPTKAGSSDIKGDER